MRRAYPNGAIHHSPSFDGRLAEVVEDAVTSLNLERRHEHPLWLRSFSDVFSRDVQGPAEYGETVRSNLGLIYSPFYARSIGRAIHAKGEFGESLRPSL